MILWTQGKNIAIQGYTQKGFRILEFSNQDVSRTIGRTKEAPIKSTDNELNNSLQKKIWLVYLHFY